MIQFQPYFSEGAAIVNISSSRDRMSQPQTESYTAAKGGISALTHALAGSLAGKPGWIDTDLIPWILPIWYSFFALKKQALSQVKTSVLMVA